jgi:hypothetical protein
VLAARTKCVLLKVVVIATARLLGVESADLTPTGFMSLRPVLKILPTQT